jgi:hypothetical protein
MQRDNLTNAQSFIVLAMGAEKVVAVHTLPKNLQEYDYVVLSTTFQCGAKRLPKDKTVTWEWVKDCLIAGRLLPLTVLSTVDIKL